MGVPFWRIITCPPRSRNTSPSHSTIAQNGARQGCVHLSPIFEVPDPKWLVDSQHWNRPIFCVRHQRESSLYPGEGGSVRTQNKINEKKIKSFYCCGWLQMIWVWDQKLVRSRRKRNESCWRHWNVVYGEVSTRTVQALYYCGSSSPKGQVIRRSKELATRVASLSW